MKTLRFEQELLSKKGRVPTISGLLSPGVPVEVTRFPKLELTSVRVQSQRIEVGLALREGFCAGT